RRVLNRRLETAAPAAIRVSDQDGESVGVSSAKIKSSKLEAARGSGAGPNPMPRSKYAMKAEVILLNRADQRVVSAGLEFTNTVTEEVFYVYPNGLSIGGRKRG